MKTRIRLQSPLTFVGETDSGHTITIDSAAELGGQNRGPRPMEMVLLGMGSCSAIDVVTILRKMREDVSDCEVELDAERADSVPKVFTRIHARYVVSGRGISRKNVGRAVELSVEKYCSVTRMLAATVNITHEYEVHELDSK